LSIPIFLININVCRKIRFYILFSKIFFDFVASNIQYDYTQRTIELIQYQNRTKESVHTTRSTIPEGNCHEEILNIMPYLMIFS